MNILQLYELQDELKGQGYVPYLNPCDADVSPDERCPECKSRELKPTGFRLNDGKGRMIAYRTFMLCGGCGHLWEY